MANKRERQREIRVHRNRIGNMNIIKKEDIIVSTDKKKLDIRLIHEFLTNSYWASGRTIDQVKMSIENTICFGIYVKNEQVGFARVLTDKVVFAYLMDVFVVKTHRGKGYSKILLDKILKHPDLLEIGKWFLGTRDAHSLYKQFQFVEIPKPELYMERLKSKTV